MTRILAVSVPWFKEGEDGEEDKEEGKEEERSWTMATSDLGA